ncbi:MAG: glycogen/starch synthase [Verrucomicrobia bacterium]|nr:glycogen/starch synthase [Verrucomicrobiota bacterium]
MAFISGLTKYREAASLLPLFDILPPPHMFRDENENEASWTDPVVYPESTQAPFFSSTLLELKAFQKDLSSSFLPSQYLRNKFKRLPPSVRQALSLGVWIAYKRPLGNPNFGEDAILSDPRLLLKICNGANKTLLEQMQDYISSYEHSGVLPDYPSKQWIAKALDDHLAQGMEKLSRTPAFPATSQKQSALDPMRFKEAVSGKGDPKAKRILLVSWEYAKIFQHGGLAPAVKGMADSLAKQGYEVDVFLPGLSLLPSTVAETLKTSDIALRFFVDGNEKVDELKVTERVGGVRFLFHSDPTNTYFRLDMPGIYQDGPLAVPDEPWVGLKKRMCYFAMGLKSYLDQTKHEYAAVGVNDWHGAYAIDRIARSHFEEWSKGLYPATVFIIHNNCYGCQGILEEKSAATMQNDFFGDSFHDGGPFNTMRQAIRWADQVVIVSPTFALEAQEEMLGSGIDPEMRAVAHENRLSGILNGANPELWNPETDAQLKNWKDPETGMAIDLTFGPDTPDIPAKKRLIAEQLQKWIKKYHPEWIEKYGIDVTKGENLLFVGRYVDQKGVDKFPQLIHAAKEIGSNFIAMGFAEESDVKENQILDACELEARTFDASQEGGKVLVIRDRKKGGRFEIQQGTEEIPGVGSLFRAMSDIGVFPSKFEPCGLVQFEGWLFAQLAIASKTGGLADTVKPVTDSDFNGFLFPRHPDWESQEQDAAVAASVKEAIKYWRSLDDTGKTACLKRVMETARSSSWTQTADGSPSPGQRYDMVFRKAMLDAAHRQERVLDLGQPTEVPSEISPGYFVQAIERGRNFILSLIETTKIPSLMLRLADE